MNTDAVTTREATAPGRRLRRAVSSRRDSLLHAGLNLLLVAMVALPVLLCILFTLDILEASYTGYDFSVYYAAGLMLRANPHANIFDLHLLQAIARAHGAALPTIPYTYPPLLAILVIPLTLFPYRAAVDIWTILNLAVWILCVILLTAWFRRVLAFGVVSRVSGRDTAGEALATASPARWIRAPRLFPVALVVFLTLSYQPIEQSLVLGQVSLFILLLLLVVPLLVERDRPYLAGGVLALAVWIKLFPALLIIYYLLRGRRRVVVGAVAGIALLGLAQVPLIGMEGVLATRHVLDNGAFQAAQFQNEALARVPLWIAAELGGHLTPALTAAGAALVVVIGVVFLAVLLRLRRQNSPQDTHHMMAHPAAANRELLGYTWALCAMVLVSPITWEHYDSWLLPAFIVCLGLAIHASATGFRDARGRIRREVYVLAATIVAYVITMHHLPLGYDGTTTFDIGPYIGGHPLRPFFMLLRPLAALLMWICSGALFLSATASTGEPAVRASSPSVRLPRVVQARVLGGFLFAVCAILAVLIAVTTAFGSYQPH
ncbi:MAG TPA: glycosyltransferase family 87 protein [Ktedonobacterales bacterium]|nr:glycosyltransferase family 87 protein [Ktedonobacterales bacterium]